MLHGLFALILVYLLATTVPLAEAGLLQRISGGEQRLDFQLTDPSLESAPIRLIRSGPSHLVSYLEGEIFLKNVVQFRALQNLFQAPQFSSKTSTEWQGSGWYSLSDFWPRSIQALNGLLLSSSQRLDLSTGQTGRLNGNCWSAALEVLRGDETELNIFQAFSDEITRVFSNRSYFNLTTRLSSIDCSSGSSPCDDLLSVLQPGDLILFRDPSRMILHTAYYLGGGLIFEKVSDREDLPYRVDLLKDMMSYRLISSNEVEILQPTSRVRDYLNTSPVHPYTEVIRAQYSIDELLQGSLKQKGDTLIELAETPYSTLRALIDVDGEQWLLSSVQHQTPLYRPSNPFPGIEFIAGGEVSETLAGYETKTETHLIKVDCRPWQDHFTKLALPKVFLEAKELAQLESTGASKVVVKCPEYILHQQNSGQFYAVVHLNNELQIIPISAENQRSLGGLDVHSVSFLPENLRFSAFSLVH